MKHILSALAVAAVVVGCGQSYESSTGGTGSGSQQSELNATTEPDNTGINKRDQSDTALTSGDQANTESDRELARNVRRAIVQNDQLSTTAQNIKIIANNGKVTLRGPVNSEQERTQIASIAQQQVQGGTIDNQLEVKQSAQSPNTQQQ